LTSFSFCARIRFETVVRRSQNRPSRVFPQTCCKAQKVERLQLPQTSRRPPLGRKAAELDQARLVRMQSQRELREPLAQVPHELLRVILSSSAVMRTPGDCHPVAGSRCW